MISIAERHKYIKEQLVKNGFIRVLDIAEQLGVTGATIRKDLVAPGTPLSLIHI